jgi:Tfp pilus assembly protein PilZ
MRFDTPAALRAEFEKNISNRGIFVATEADFEIRQAVDVEIELFWVPSPSSRVVLRGEIVHRLSPEMVRGGGRAGVAVQFEESVAELRERFEPFLGEEALPDPDVDQAGERRRSARRSSVRVPVRIRSSKRAAFAATSRDLSGTGILLSIREERLELNEVVRIGLRHPSGEPSVELAGRVVREVLNKRGQVAAVAVAFDRQQAADPTAQAVIAALREASHQGRLGGISGSIVDLGLPNMLQMFGSSAREGTLVVEREGEQGWIAFADNQFLAAELGSTTGKRAIEEMLGWTDGRFEFEARVDPNLLASAAREPLAGVVLEAVCARDERGRSKPPDAGPAIEFSGDAIFVVDVEQEEVARGSLDKTELAVLDLARSRMSVARIEAIIPEAPERIRAAVASLVEMGVLIPD